MFHFSIPTLIICILLRGKSAHHYEKSWGGGGGGGGSPSVSCCVPFLWYEFCIIVVPSVAVNVNVMTTNYSLWDTSGLFLKSASFYVRINSGLVLSLYGQLCVHVWYCMNWCVCVCLCAGTLRPDLIESASMMASGEAAVIKTHHNDSDLVRELRDQVKGVVLRVLR